MLVLPSQSQEQRTPFSRLLLCRLPSAEILSITTVKINAVWSQWVLIEMVCVLNPRRQEDKKTRNGL